MAPPLLEHQWICRPKCSCDNPRKQRPFENKVSSSAKRFFDVIVGIEDGHGNHATMKLGGSDDRKEVAARFLVSEIENYGFALEPFQLVGGCRPVDAEFHNHRRLLHGPAKGLDDCIFSTYE